MQNDDRPPPPEGGNRLFRKTPGHRHAAARGERSDATPGRSAHQNRSVKTPAGQLGRTVNLTQTEDGGDADMTQATEASPSPPPLRGKKRYPAPPPKRKKRKRFPIPFYGNENSATVFEAVNVKMRPGRTNFKKKKILMPFEPMQQSTDRMQESDGGGTTDVGMGTDMYSKSPLVNRRKTIQQRTEESNFAINVVKTGGKLSEMQSDYNVAPSLPGSKKPYGGYVKAFWKTAALIEIFVNVILVLLIIACCLLFFSGLIDFGDDALPTEIQSTSTIPTTTTTEDPITRMCVDEVNNIVAILVMGMQNIDDTCDNENFYTFTESSLNKIWMLEVSEICVKRKELPSLAFKNFKSQLNDRCPVEMTNTTAMTTTKGPPTDEEKACNEMLKKCRYHHGIRQVASVCNETLLDALEMGIAQQCTLKTPDCMCSNKCNKDIIASSIRHLYYDFYNEKCKQ